MMRRICKKSAKIGHAAFQISEGFQKPGVSCGQFPPIPRVLHGPEALILPGSVLIPLGDLPDRFTELDANREIIAQCKSGMRSARAAAFLRELGFKNVKNLKGGVLAWVDQVDPSQPKY